MSYYNSVPDIMNVREIIDSAFGDFEGNAVNFKLVQTVLFLFARQLRLLERRVEVELSPSAIMPTASTLAVTEVKIHAMQKKMKKTKDGDKSRGKSGGKGKSGRADKATSDKYSSEKTSSDRTYSEKTSSDKTSTDKTYTDKTFTDKTSTDKAFTDKTSTDKTFTDKTFTDKTSTDKTSTDKTSTDKHSTDKTSTDKTSTDKTSTDKTSTDKTSIDKSSTDKTSTDKTSADKSSTDKTSTDKTSADKTSAHKTSTDKTSIDKTSIDKTSADKSSTDKTSSDKTLTEKSSGQTTSDKTSTDKSSSDKTSADKTTSSSKDKSSSKSSSDKTRDKQAKADKTKESRGDKTREYKDDKTSSRRGTEKDSSKRRSKSGGGGGTQGGKQRDSYHNNREILEERKEKQLRVIHQRSDSFKEGTHSPTPMASVTSMESQHEKVLVVQRVPSSEAGAGAVYGQRKAPQISVVTQQQFEQVVDAVRKLEDNLLPVGTPGFPENIELMKELRRGASLTDAMAALQLSARLEATEKAIGQMILMITELAQQTPGVEIDSETEAIFGALGHYDTDVENAQETTEKSRGVHGGTKRKRGRRSKSGPDGGISGGRIDGEGIGGKGLGGKGIGGEVTTPRARKSKDISGKTTTTAAQTPGILTDPYTVGMMSDKSVESIEMMSPPAISSDVYTADEYALKTEYVSYNDLKHSLKKIYDGMLHTVKTVTARTASNAEQAYKLALNLDDTALIIRGKSWDEARCYAENALREVMTWFKENWLTLNVSKTQLQQSYRLKGKVEAAKAATSKMDDLENLVSQYAAQINILDTGLSSQMTNYQEQLTQMQHDLENGLETMAEVLGNTGGDTVAMAELNSHFTSLQLDLENMLYRQRDLKDAQDSISFDLENLWKEIERLRDTKSDREEVADALRDKAGIGELNGIVSLQQFNAVIGEFEKRIGEAYNKFNNQELVWQRIIDDLTRDLNEKADLIQIYSLRDEINKYLNIIKGQMQILIDIVGEPKSAATSKKLFRNTACLSCGSPAHMDQEEPSTIPKLPKARGVRQAGEGTETEPKGDGDHGICIPNLTIPHPRDPRSHICRRYCGGSHTLVNEGPSRIPPSMTIQQPLKRVNTELGADGQMYLVDERPKQVPCLPCNLPKPTPPPTEPENAATVPAENTESTVLTASQAILKPGEDIETVLSVTPPAIEVE